MSAWTVGVDFGGTNIKVGLVSAQGRLGPQRVLFTSEHRTPPAFLDGLDATIKALGGQASAASARPRGIGIGCPGLVDSDRGVIHRLVNVPGGWRGVALRRLLERRFRCPCAVDNDANVVALGEWKYGAGRLTHQSVYVTLGTGVGGGLVVNGRFVRGALGSAGEIGHMILRPEGPACACGSRGCLEVYVGSAGIVRQAKQASRKGGGVLSQLVQRSGGAWSPRLVDEAARAGDRAARRVWEAVGENLGVIVANLINLLNPERVVIGGRVSRAWRWFAPSMRSTVRSRAFRVPAAGCRVVRAQLGDAAGIIGAAMLVQDEVRGERGKEVKGERCEERRKIFFHSHLVPHTSRLTPLT